jgi:serine/threonine protein kinase
MRPRLKLCDFGASRDLGANPADPGDLGDLGDPEDLTNYVGSRWYRAPETLANRTSYGLEVDVWGAACILCELATGENLFDGSDENKVTRSSLSFRAIYV